MSHDEVRAMLSEMTVWIFFYLTGMISGYALGWWRREVKYEKDVESYKEFKEVLDKKSLEVFK